MNPRSRTVPLLPCPAIDEAEALFSTLRFTVTHRQQRPNPYLALHLDEFDLDLHYFGIDGFRPEDSYGSCLVVVEEVGPLFEHLAAGLRERYGKLPMAGFPRITRPRSRRNNAGLSGFSLVDTGGNWIRVTRGSTGSPEQPESEDALSRAVANAVVLADSKGDPAQARRILAGALAREQARADATARVEAEAYLAELALRAGDRTAANRHAERARQLSDRTPETEREQIRATLAALVDVDY